jgi:hypothetical protein
MPGTPIGNGIADIVIFLLWLKAIRHGRRMSGTRQARAQLHACSIKERRRPRSVVKCPAIWQMATLCFQLGIDSAE